jgi:glycosyltransferase involved in cell wall biosynthesis
MDTNAAPFADLNRRSLFLVWGPPSYGPRSQVFARALGIEELHFLYSTTKRGLLTAPSRYAYQAVRTLTLLFRKRPKIVFVQSPPSLAVLFVYIYCALTDSRYVIDAHSAALQLPFWTRPQWLHSYLARRAITTIVTNEHYRHMIDRWGGHAFVLRDIPTTFPKADFHPLNGAFNVVVVNTFSTDEPLPEILEAATGLDDVQFHITGKKSNARRDMLAKAPGNVQFTDFLPDAAYYGLLASSQAVVCLTTRDHTMQRGACEALSLGKPIITSKWPLLQSYFHKGTVHVDNSAEAIRRGVLHMKQHHGLYQAGIKDLQVEQRREWQEKIVALTGLIRKSIESNYTYSKPI